MHCGVGLRGGSSLPPSSGRFSSRPRTSLCDEPAQRSHLFVQPRCREILRGQHARGFSEIQCNSSHPPDQVSYASMGDFYSDLKSVLGLRMLWKVVLGVRRNDLLGLAGQLAYFFLLFFFPFLIFLVSLTGLVIGNPEAGLKSLFEALTGLVPADARALVVDYVDRTLRSASTGALVFGILGALWLGQAASISITKAANRSYRLAESRPFWQLRGACLTITLGFTLLIAVLTLAVFNVGAHVLPMTGLPDTNTGLGKLLSWAMIF